MWWRCICIVGPKINALADEDQEQDPDRWCSHTAMGQEAWQIVSQWVWNLRLELGHQLHPDPVRTTEFAPALPPAQKETLSPSPTQRVWTGRSGSALETRSLLGARLSPPAGWHAPLPRWAVACGAR